MACQTLPITPPLTTSLVSCPYSFPVFPLPICQDRRRYPSSDVSGSDHYHVHACTSASSPPLTLTQATQITIASPVAVRNWDASLGSATALEATTHLLAGGAACGDEALRGAGVGRLHVMVLLFLSRLVCSCPVLPKRTSRLVQVPISLLHSRSRSHAFHLHPWRTVRMPPVVGTAVVPPGNDCMQCARNRGFNTDAAVHARLAPCSCWTSGQLF
jgi:hypothetical protein